MEPVHLSFRPRLAVHHLASPLPVTCLGKLPSFSPQQLDPLWEWAWPCKADSVSLNGSMASSTSRVLKIHFKAERCDFEYLSSLDSPSPPKGSFTFLTALLQPMQHFPSSHALITTANSKIQAEWGRRRRAQKIQNFCFFRSFFCNLLLPAPTTK